MHHTKTGCLQSLCATLSLASSLASPLYDTRHRLSLQAMHSTAIPAACVCVRCAGEKDKPSASKTHAPVSSCAACTRAQLRTSGRARGADRRRHTALDGEVRGRRPALQMAAAASCSSVGYQPAAPWKGAAGYEAPVECVWRQTEWGETECIAGRAVDVERRKAARIAVQLEKVAERRGST